MQQNQFSQVAQSISGVNSNLTSVTTASSKVNEENYLPLYSNIKRELLSKTNELKKLSCEKNQNKLKSFISTFIKDIPDAINIPPQIFDKLQNDLINDIVGLGVIQPFLDDPEVTEIMVNNSTEIYIQKNGINELTNVRFESEDALKSTIDRIVQRVGRYIDEANPIVDARLPEGHRVNATLYPIATRGHQLVIRKHPTFKLTAEDLINKGSAPGFIYDFLRMMVQAGINVFLSGGTNSGKTTLLNVLSNYLTGDNERIAVVEDSAELKLSTPGTIYYESRPPNAEGKGAIKPDFLIANCLRISPSRIIMGECRKSEANEMLQAMNTGHDGSMSTGHSNSPRDMLSRLEYMCGGGDLVSLRKQISSAINVVVQVLKDRSSGKRQIVEIAEIAGLDEKGDYIVNPIFQQKYPLKIGETDIIKWTGYYPTFLDRLECDQSFWDKLKQTGYYKPIEQFLEYSNIEIKGEIIVLTATGCKLKIKNGKEIICFYSEKMSKTEYAFLNFLKPGDSLHLIGRPNEKPLVLENCYIKLNLIE